MTIEQELETIKEFKELYKIKIRDKLTKEEFKRLKKQWGKVRSKEKRKQKQFLKDLPEMLLLQTGRIEILESRFESLEKNVETIFNLIKKK